jgi:collagenase-like PrtC family protease
MKISLAPVPYFWPREDLLAFYDRMLETPVDIIYLGETVCSKRRALNIDEWLELAERIQNAGKEAVISTLSLLEAESELRTLRRLCENGRFMVEANDMAAVNRLTQNADKEKVPFVTGPTVNIYNQHTLRYLSRLGMHRWVMPVELSRDTLADLQRERPENLQTEITAYGRLPLAIAARCFTARYADLPKDDCQLRCLDYPDGLLLKTREEQSFLNINGVQLQSAQAYNLIMHTDELKALGVDVLRITPQFRNTEQIINIFRAALDGEMDTDSCQRRLAKINPAGDCDGYWYGEAGIKSLQATARDYASETAG